MEELARLRWRCRRGTKELDIMVQRYLDHYYESAPADERHAFSELLDFQDPYLYDLLTRRVDSPDSKFDKIIEKIEIKL